MYVLTQLAGALIVFFLILILIVIILIIGACSGNKVERHVKIDKDGNEETTYVDKGKSSWSKFCKIMLIILAIIFVLLRLLWILYFSFE